MRSLTGDTAGATKPLPHRSNVAHWWGVGTFCLGAVAGISGAGLLLIGGSALVYQQHKAAALVAHTREVIGAEAKLEADLATVTSEARGFLLNKSASNQTRFQAASRETDRDLVSLRVLTLDSAVQQQNLAQLDPLVARRQENLRQLLQRAAAGDTMAVGRAIAGDEDRGLMDAVFVLTGRIAAEERRLLNPRIEAGQNAEKYTMAAGVGYGILVTESLAMVIALLMGRRRERGHLAIQRRLNADLEDHASARTTALLASEDRFQQLAERANGMVSVVGPDGEPCYVSPAAADLFGVQPEALLGHGVLERTRPEDRSALELFLRRLLAGTVEEEEVAFRAFRPDASVLWIEAGARRLRHAVTGAHDGYIIVWRDVSARRHAEISLNESGTRFRLLAEQTSDAIVCLDLELRRTYLSPAYFDVFGYQPEAVNGCQWGVHIHPADREAVHRQLLRLAAGMSDHEKGTYREQHKAGHWIWVEASCDLVRDPRTEMPASIICVLRDVSERVVQADELRNANLELERLARHIAEARDAAQQASRTKSRFLTTMSHELRTPLNGIIGYSEMLSLEGGLTAAQLAIVEKLQSAGHHLLEMITGVLDLSEVEADHVVMNVAKTDLTRLGAACLDLVRRSAEIKGLTVSMAMAPDTPQEMTVDPARLRQVLLNLLGNAVKFTAQGSVTLQFRAAAAADCLRIEVVDTGRGIAPEERHLLFREFERLGSDLADVMTEGAGLGLTISMRLVALMGGRIGYAENQPCGSVFWFEIPLGSQGAASLPVSDGATAQPPVTGPLRILLVDDVLMNRDIASSFLRSANHIVVLAEGGAEAVALAGSTDFDVILMDVRMPEMDGLEATRRVRTIEGPRGRVPIVALTAQAFVEQVAECRLAGMNAHLVKPYTRESLLTCVAAAYAAGQRRNAEPLPAGAALRRDHAPVELNPERSAVPVVGKTRGAAETEEPMIDVVAFEKTAALLTPQAVTSYLGTIGEQATSLLARVRALSVSENAGDDLAEAAHMLAGSAGLFGFRRLSVAAREFEHAARMSSPETPMFAESLTVCLKGSLNEIRRRLPATSAV